MDSFVFDLGWIAEWTVHVQERSETGPFTSRTY